MLLPSECYLPSSDWGSTLILLQYESMHRHCLLQRADLIQDPITDVTTSCELAAVIAL